MLKCITQVTETRGKGMNVTEKKTKQTDSYATFTSSCQSSTISLPSPGKIQVCQSVVGFFFLSFFFSFKDPRLHY